MSDRPAPRFGPRVRTYEQQITAEFEQEIAELNLKLCERDMDEVLEIERLREETESWEALAEHQIWCRQCYEGGTENCEIAGPLLQEARRLRGMRAASRDEERDHG